MLTQKENVNVLSPHVAAAGSSTKSSTPSKPSAGPDLPLTQAAPVMVADMSLVADPSLEAGRTAAASDSGLRVENR